MKSKTVAVGAALTALSLTTAACGGGSASGEGAEELDIKLSSFIGPAATHSEAIEQWIADIDTASDGNIKIEQVFNEGLLPALDTLPGVGDGRAKLGFISTLYYPGEMPLSQVIAAKPYQTANIPAQMATLNELAQGDELTSEMANQGVKTMFWGISLPMTLGCQEPITSIDDFKGKQIRAVPPLADALEGLGANIVAVAAPDIRDSIERGLLDCWTNMPLDTVVSFGLLDVTDNIYDMEYGTYATGNVVMNLSTWDSLSDEQRTIFEEASAKVPDYFTEVNDEVAAQACDDVEEAGAEVQKLPADVVAELAELTEPEGEKIFLDGAGSAGEDFLQKYEDMLTEDEADFSDYQSTLTSCADRFAS